MKTPGVSSNTSYTLHVVSTSTEYSNSDTASVTQDLNVTVKAVTTAAPPSISGDQDSHVSEEGLLVSNGAPYDGDPDSDPNTTDDTTDDTTQSGQFTVFDVNGDSLAVTLSAPSGSYSSGRDSIVWNLTNNDQTLTGTTQNGGDEIMTVTIDNDGNYTTTLKGPIDHQDTTKEDTLKIPVTVTVSDGDSNTPDVSSTLNVVIEDDRPSAQSHTENVTIDTPTTNISFVIDISSSMSDSDLQYSEDAIDNLITKYDEIGDVNVKVVQFYGNGNYDTDWVSNVHSINDLPQNFNWGGSDHVLDNSKSGTDIEQGLHEMVDTYTTGNYAAGDQDVMYFFGDGNTYDAYKTDFDNYTGVTQRDSNDTDEDGGEKVTAFDENNTWTNFITGGTIEKLFTYSVKTNDALYDLQHLADNNENIITDDAVAVSDISDLSTYVGGTVGMYTEGDILESSGTTYIDYGADGGHIESITINNITVTYDPNNPTQKVDGAYGVYTINFDTGKYTYQGKNYIDHSEDMQASIVDGDGDHIDSVLVTNNFDYADSFPDNAASAPDLTMDIDDTPTIVAGDPLVTTDKFTGSEDSWVDENGNNNDVYENNNKLRIDDWGPHTASKTFDFGIDNANKTVTITFDTDIRANRWDGGSDYMRVYVDGQEVYSKTQESDLDNGTTHTINNVQLDSNGQISISIKNDSTDNNEWLDIDNFQIEVPQDNYKYQIDMTPVLTDTDGSESLQDLLLRDLPSDLVKVEDSSGNAISADANGNYIISSSPSSGSQVTAYIYTLSQMSQSEVDAVASRVSSVESNGGDTTTVEVHENDTSAQIIDGIIVGMYYETSSGLHGYTDTDGYFDYADGDVVTFKIGNITVGEIDTATIDDGKVFLQDLAGTERNDLDNHYVENMAVLLQSLDNDSDAYNGIVITDKVVESLNSADIDLVHSDTADLTAALKSAGITPVDVDSAMEHVKDMLVENTDLDENDFSDATVSEESSQDSGAVTAESEESGSRAVSMDDEDSTEPLMIVDVDTIFMPALESMDISFVEENIAISQSGIHDISEILVDITGSESGTSDGDIVIDIPSSDDSAESSTSDAVTSDTPAAVTAESDVDYGSAPDPTVVVNVDDSIDTHSV